MSPQLQFILLSLGICVLAGFDTYVTVFFDDTGESWFSQSKQHMTTVKSVIKRCMTTAKSVMMSPQRQRILLFLSGCILVGFGACVMMFGDTHEASYVGGVLTRMGMIINFAQLLFQLPLGLPRRNIAQENELFFPSSSPRKKSQQQGELILPASYYHALRRRQKARLDRVLAAVLMLVVFVLLVEGALYQDVFPLKGSCVNL